MPLSMDREILSPGLSENSSYQTDTLRAVSATARGRTNLSLSSEAWLMKMSHRSLIEPTLPRSRPK